MKQCIKYLSLFSGLGAFESALSNANIDYEVLNFCEIDEYASLCYSKIHNIDIEKNLGDITKIDIAKLPKDIDLLTHGSPCQDFSISGKNNGGDENSGTRSSLMWNSVNIISYVKPKYVIWENVKNVLSSKHKHNFDKYLNVMECLGYKNYVKIFNSKHFQLPQNRERIFIISIRKDIETNFDLNEIKLNHTINPIKNFIEDIDNIDKRHFVTRPLRPLNIKQKSDIITIGEVSSKGSQAGKVYDINGLFPTICAGTHGYAFGYIYQNNKVRQITPQEAFLFMGFSKKEYKQCEELGISHTQLYKMAGNAIAVPILEEIFKKLL